MASPTIARVAIDLGLNREFDYRIPDHLQGKIEVGSRVEVPFGKTVRQGSVTSLADASSVPGLKPIAGLKGDRPFITESILRLARWMAGYYCAPLEHCLRTVLPGAVRKQRAAFRKQFYLSLTEGALDATDDNAHAAEHPLTEQQVRVIDLLRIHGTTLLTDILREAQISRSPVETLRKHGLVELSEASISRNPLAGRQILPTLPLSLMPEQAAALKTVIHQMNREEAGVVLLHGVTGSGKTEVYLQAIDHALENGKGAIVLVPEIALTPQTVQRFVARFGPRVAVLHSHLSDGERHDEWHRIRGGEARIVVGARSAVFAPVENLGLIAVDEEHEPSYKQDESPRYNARDVAVMRGHIEKAVVILGTATPSLESWQNVKRGKYTLTSLTKRVDDRRMPSLRVVDMRIETERTGKVAIFSQDLLEGIRLRLERGEQTILFLNRRGFASSLICPHCGYVAVCEHCSVSLTYHRPHQCLLCHICGASRKVPDRCPGCSDPEFRYSGMGTQRVEAIVRKCFPYATIQRMDRDSTVRKDAYETILDNFRSGKIHILIGTQMIAKGLHFPNVTLVGVLRADQSLHLPDFRAGERTFQLLAQVAGRAGRGDVAGEVIVQTYTPFEPAIQAARRHDFIAFSEEELEFLRQLAYPPFTHLICLTVRGPKETPIAEWLTGFTRQLKKQLDERVVVADPAPAPLARARGQFRYQLMMRCRTAKAMSDPLRKLLEKSKLPKDAVAIIDIDALSLL